ncbi:MAG TPA: cytochrome c [Gammaproteobacteria bacterium]|nr:cytochrome c [Gammaproteobacteria bacterium]
MKSLKCIGIVIAVVVVAGLAFIYSGLYDVAATAPDSALAQWALKTTRERSVESRSEDVKPPQGTSLSDPKLINLGFRHYDEMCVMCHGAPGVEPGEAHAGLNPQPPDLAKHAKEMEPGELFWVIKHGIRMTGMPAWGPTHSDHKIWAMVAFIKHLPEVTPAEYQRLRREAAAHPMEDDDHDH